jgi:hypothetical protein
VVVDGTSKFGSGFARSLVQEPLFNVVIAEADLNFPDSTCYYYLENILSEEDPFFYIKF